MFVGIVPGMSNVVMGMSVLWAACMFGLFKRHLSGSSYMGRGGAVFFLRRKSIVQYLGCSNWMVRITGFSNKSCSAFACCNRVRYIVP